MNIKLFMSWFFVCLHLLSATLFNQSERSSILSATTFNQSEHSLISCWPITEDEDDSRSDNYLKNKITYNR